jgi:hypothetical protein
MSAVFIMRKRMTSEKKLRAKANVHSMLNNPGLKPRVIGSEAFMDFSPKHLIAKYLI